MILDGHQASAMATAATVTRWSRCFHQERVQIDDKTDPLAIVGQPNWKIWRVNLSTLEAEIDGIDWNSGATYQSWVDDLNYVLVPGEKYATTKGYAVNGASAELRLQTNGWTVRAFRVR